MSLWSCTSVVKCLAWLRACAYPLNCNYVGFQMAGTHRFSNKWFSFFIIAPDSEEKGKMDGEKKAPDSYQCAADAPDSYQCHYTDDWWKQALSEAEVDLFGLVDDTGSEEAKCGANEKSNTCYANITAGSEFTNEASAGENNPLTRSMELGGLEISNQLSPGLPGVQHGSTVHSKDSNAVFPTTHSGSFNRHEGSNCVTADEFEDGEGSLDTDPFLKFPIPPSYVPHSDEGEEDQDSGPGKEIRKDTATDFDEEASALEALIQVRERFDAAHPLSCSNQFGVTDEQTPDIPDPQSPWSVKFPPQHICDSIPDHTLPDAYIEQASMLITKAIQLESQEDYHEAFDLLKAGVDLLLNGVQSMCRCT